MTQGAANPSRAKGRTITLVVLHSLDILLGLVPLMAVMGFWLMTPQNSPGESAVTGIFTFLIVQSVLFRIPALIVRASWTFRLVSNAQAYQDVKISPRWAWLGWFVPVVSFWLPARAVLQLNGGRDMTYRRPLIIGWWILRGCTCFTGFTLLLLGLAVYAGFQAALTETPGDSSSVSFAWASIWVVAGMASSILGLIVTLLTFNAQPKGNDMAAATVF